MQNHIKKLLTILTVACLCFTCLPQAVFAEELDEDEQETVEEEEAQEAAEDEAEGLDEDDAEEGGSGGDDPEESEYAYTEYELTVTPGRSFTITEYADCISSDWPDEVKKVSTVTGSFRGDDGEYHYECRHSCTCDTIGDYVITFTYEDNEIIVYTVHVVEEEAESEEDEADTDDNETDPDDVGENTDKDSNPEAEGEAEEDEADEEDSGEEDLTDDNEMRIVTLIGSPFEITVAEGDNVTPSEGLEITNTTVNDDGTVTYVLEASESGEYTVTVTSEDGTEEVYEVVVEDEDEGQSMFLISADLSALTEDEYPESIQVTVYGEFDEENEDGTVTGSAMSDIVELNAENGYSYQYTFTETGVYSITAEAEGYDCSVSGSMEDGYVVTVTKAESGDDEGEDGDTDTTDGEDSDADEDDDSSSDGSSSDSGSDDDYLYDGEGKGENVQTGDNYVMYILLAVATLLLAGGSALTIKKHNN